MDCLLDQLYTIYPTAFGTLSNSTCTLHNFNMFFMNCRCACFFIDVSLLKTQRIKITASMNHTTVTLISTFHITEQLCVCQQGSWFQFRSFWCDSFCVFGSFLPELWAFTGQDCALLRCCHDTYLESFVCCQLIRCYEQEKKKGIFFPYLMSFICQCKVVHYINALVNMEYYICNYLYISVQCICFTFDFTINSLFYLWTWNSQNVLFRRLDVPFGLPYKHSGPRWQHSLKQRPCYMYIIKEL